MQSKKDRFLEALGELLDAELQMIQVLKQRTQEVQGCEIEETFWTHLRETQEQVQNLRRCFAMLGRAPKRYACLAIEHWQQKHDAFLSNRTWSDTMITMFDLSEARRISRYEIASYQGAIRQAQSLGETACVKLLQQNLSQEEQMAQKTTLFSYVLAPQLRPE